MISDEDVYLLIKKVVYSRKYIKFQDKDDVVSEMYLRIKMRGVTFDNEHKVLGYVFKSIFGVWKKVIKNNYGGLYIDGDIEADRDMLCDILLMFDKDTQDILIKLVVDRYTWRDMKAMGYSYRRMRKVINEVKEVIAI